MNMDAIEFLERLIEAGEDVTVHESQCMPMVIPADLALDFVRDQKEGARVWVLDGQLFISVNILSRDTVDSGIPVINSGPYGEWASQYFDWIDNVEAELYSTNEAIIKADEDTQAAIAEDQERGCQGTKEYYDTFWKEKLYDYQNGIRPMIIHTIEIILN